MRRPNFDLDPEASKSLRQMLAEADARLIASGMSAEDVVELKLYLARVALHESREQERRMGEVPRD